MVTRAAQVKGSPSKFLTRRGWQVFETQWEVLQALDEELSKIPGAKKFEDLKNTLRQLSSDGGPEATGRARIHDNAFVQRSRDIPARPTPMGAHGWIGLCRAMRADSFVRSRRPFKLSIAKVPRGN